ncbi:MAG: flagellar hook-length control protein FliK [Alphaproteobacteria bacterium]
MQAAQKPDNSNKADAASPFAILVQEAAPKDAAKTAHKDSHSSDDKKDGDKPSVKKDDKTAASSQTQARPVQKAEKSDKSDDKAVQNDKQDDATAKTDDTATQDQAAQPQPVVQQQAQQPATLVPANDDEGDAEEIAAAGDIQDSKPALQAAQNNNSPAQPDQDQVEDAQAATGQNLNKALNARPGDKPVKSANTKNDAKTGDIKAAKADAADNTAATSTADAKAAAANAALNDKAAATHDAARPANADTSMAVHSLGAPQAQQQAPANAPVITQHVQVAQQPTPNVPALAVEIAAKSQSGAKQFDIRLDPPELGRVEVRLSIDAAGKASAHLSADQPQTLDLLQKDAPALTRALREAGLDVSQDGLNFSLRHQNSDSSASNNGGNRGNGRGFSLAATNSIDATATSAAYRSVADGRLDIRV